MVDLPIVHFRNPWHNRFLTTSIIDIVLWHSVPTAAVYLWIVGLRPALEGFVVTMHEGACETGSQIPTA